MKRHSVMFLAVLIIIALIAGSPLSPAQVQATGGGELRLGMPVGQIDHLDPALWYFAMTWRIGFATATPLVTFPDASGEAGKEIVGGLAELPEVSEDGKTYTFTLKPGITFADGTPITGEDVKATFERLFAPELASPATGFFTDIVGAEAFAAGDADTISGITVDANKVIFQLESPLASFLNRMTMMFTVPVPKGTPPTPMENGELLVTGPYVVESYVPQRELVLVRNPNYPSDVLGERGLVDRIVIQIGVDPAQAALMIRAGEIDSYLENLAPGDAAQALDDPTLQDRVFTGTRAEIIYLALNNDVPPFDNVKVRQAFNYAINRNAIVRIWGGPSQAEPTDQILPPTMAGWKDVEIYPASGDVEKAKELLVESGVNLPIETSLHTAGDMAGWPEVAQAVQAQLKEVGINVEIQTYVSSVFSAKAQTRADRLPLMQNMWSQDYPDPDNFINVLLDGTRITETNNQNVANFDVAEVNEEIASLAGVSGPERDERYNALDVHIMRDYAPWAPLFNPVRVEMISERVTNFVVHPVYGPDIAVMAVGE